MSFCKPLNLQNNNYSCCGVRMTLSDTHIVSSASTQARIDARDVEIQHVKNIIADTRKQIMRLQKCGDFDSGPRKRLNFKIHDQRKKLHSLLLDQDREIAFKEALERQEAKNRETIERLRILQK